VTRLSIGRALVIAALTPYGALWAQQAPAGDRAEASEQPESERPNRAALYLGFTSNDGTDFTAGVEYTRRSPGWKAFGIGGFAEIVFAHDTEFLTGITFHYFAPKRLVLEAGPGLSFNHDTEFLVRVGAAYELETARWAISPKAYVDFVADETTVGFGVAIGRVF
jgi:hypothetical protein